MFIYFVLLNYYQFIKTIENDAYNMYFDINLTHHLIQIK